MLKKLRTPKGCYWIKQRFSSIAPLFKIGTSLMPRSHIHGLPRRFHYGSNPTDDPGNANFRSPNGMHNASTTTYDYGCNTEIYGLIRIATDDAGSYPWQILRQIGECVTWALKERICFQRERILSFMSSSL